MFTLRGDNEAPTRNLHTQMAQKMKEGRWREVGNCIGRNESEGGGEARAGQRRDNSAVSIVWTQSADSWHLKAQMTSKLWLGAYISKRTLAAKKVA